MARLIDADALKSFYASWSDENTEFIKAEVDRFVDLQITIDAEPVRHGHWGNYEPDLDGYRCSCCKLVHRTCTTYCPHCGSEMDEVSE